MDSKLGEARREYLRELMDDLKRLESNWLFQLWGPDSKSKFLAA